MNTNPKCPRCGGEITRGEPKCKHCGVLLKWKNPLQKEETKGETAPAGAITVRLPPPPTPESPQNAGAGAGARFCPQCGKKLVAGQRFCPGCGAAAGGGARPGFGRPSHGNGNPPEGMRRLTVDERPPSFTEAWGRGWRFSWKGRATRQEYWFRILSLLIECLILGGVAGAILGAGGGGRSHRAYGSVWIGGMYSEFVPVYPASSRHRAFGFLVFCVALARPAGDRVRQIHVLPRCQGSLWAAQFRRDHHELDFCSSSQ